jgi:hypothetical protein
MHSRAFALSQGDIVTSWDSLVYYNPIVPKGYRSWCPLPAGGEVICVEEMLAEEREDVMGFLAV